MLRTAQPPGRGAGTPSWDGSSPASGRHSPGAARLSPPPPLLLPCSTLPHRCHPPRMGQLSSASCSRFPGMTGGDEAEPGFSPRAPSAAPGGTLSPPKLSLSRSTRLRRGGCRADSGRLSFSCEGGHPPRGPYLLTARLQARPLAQLLRLGLPGLFLPLAGQLCPLLPLPNPLLFLFLIFPLLLLFFSFVVSLLCLCFPPLLLRKWQSQGGRKHVRLSSVIGGD